MREQEKIDEAAHFRQRMAQVESDDVAFRYELSAFLSAARSVLQYARKEAAPKAGGKVWYDARMTSSRVLQFFKSERDLNVHAEPVVPQRAIEVSIQEHVRVSVVERWTLKGPNGEVVAQGGSAPGATPAPAAPAPATVVYRYFFPDWTGHEEVPVLCNLLLNELRDVVAEGRQRGLLT